MLDIQKLNLVKHQPFLTILKMRIFVIVRAGRSAHHYLLNCLTGAQPLSTHLCSLSKLIKKSAPLYGTRNSINRVQKKQTEIATLAARIAQSVWRLATGWTIRGSNLGGGGGEIFQTGPGAHPASCTMVTGSFSGVKRPGRGADPAPPSSVPRS